MKAEASPFLLLPLLSTPVPCGLPSLCHWGSAMVTSSRTNSPSGEPRVTKSLEKTRAQPESECLLEAPPHVLPYGGEG